MIKLNFLSEMVAKCVIGDSAWETVKNAVALSRTSTTYYGLVNREKFFLDLIRIIDPLHPFLLVKERKWEIINFKNLFFQSREPFFVKREIMPLKNELFSLTSSQLIRKRILANGDGVVCLSFLEGIHLDPLESDAKPVYLNFPESDYPDLMIFRTNRYLAINTDSEKPVYIYTADGKTLLSEYHVEGVLQFGIVGQRLYIVDKQVELFRYNLGDSEDKPIKITLPDQVQKWDDQKPFVFTKDYIIYTPHQVIKRNKYVLPVACLNNHDGPLPWIEVKLIGTAWYLLEDGFIEIKNDEIFKVTFLKDSCSRKLIGQQKIEHFVSRLCSENRLFNSIKKENEIVLTSQDLITGQLIPLLSITDGLHFRSSMHCVANKMYYLVQKPEEQIELITITFGRV